MMYCVVWGLTQMSFLLVSQYLKEWYNYLFWIITIPSLFILIIAYVYLKQTPSFFLLNKKDKEKCKSIVK